MPDGSLPVPTISELADYLRIPKSFLCLLTLKGNVPRQKGGGHWRFWRFTDNWLKANQHAWGRGQREGGES